ncbi:YcnI family protein [Streptomyces sp. ME02-6978a]|uniref:YcnI family protein n=1 Tax=unclassified Streptomyces TaxID=2593676 RepID=UPI0029AF5DBA|nr:MULTISPECIES: YcnI family protein [unclassified Streptomyces]MDX3086636.1 YcnI family protein [Streptomyces sp. ME12-02E]MDX3330020.1 YcnI family protein [Streptomyces sp. ME02-6978a]
MSTATRTTTLRRAGVLAGLAAATVLTAAGAASAHVGVHPGSYAKGATDGVLTFRVPNEEDTASTTEVRVYLPTDHPVLGVLVSPQNGWKAEVATTKLRKPVKTDDGSITEAVSRVTFSGGRIRHGQYQDFDIAFGRLPEDTGTLTFKTLQTYSNGDVVRWIEVPQKGAEEPEHPAPTLTLTAEGAAGEDGSAQAAGDTAKSARAVPDATPVAQPKASSAAEDSTARALGIAGLVAGLLGLATVFAFTRDRAASATVPAADSGRAARADEGDEK